MKTFLQNIVSVLITLLFIEYTHASYGLPRLQEITSAVLMSVDSGQILYAQNENHRVEPGDLIQIMTLELAYDALEKGIITPNAVVAVPNEEENAENSIRKVFTVTKQKVPYLTVLNAIAIVNAHDACIMAANYLADSREIFARRMNGKALSLGLSSTLIDTSYGTAQDSTTYQCTTALDMAKLANFHIKNHPELLEIYSKPFFSYEGVHYKNKNFLLDADEHIDGLKYAKINDVTYHTITTGKWHNGRYIVVIMGANSKKIAKQRASVLLARGFMNFENVCLFKKGEVITACQVLKGERSVIPLVSKKNIMVTIPKGTRKKLEYKHIIEEAITAPVTLDRALGTLTIALDGKTVKVIKLFPSHQIEKAHFFKRIWQSIIHTFT
jgi:D-alanyl-D-alanine carboxypeptidase (penicillin-binding protein 5/6)